MGGLFSSSERKPQRQSNYSNYPRQSQHIHQHDQHQQVKVETTARPTYSQSYHTQQYWDIQPRQIINENAIQYENNTASRQLYSDTAAVLRNFEQLSIAGRRRQVIQKEVAEQSKVNPYIIFDMAYVNEDTPVVQYISLLQYDPEYQKVTRMITNKRNFIVESIEKIVNPYLEKAYMLKKEEKLRYYGNVEERLLFHGTKRENVNDICQTNFNWRLCKAHKYGEGVSFSPNSTYATNYSDQNVYNKIMIVAKVLIAKSCFGHENMTLPDPGCDTSQKGHDAIVIVKYEDNEFCPSYRINYHLLDENVGKRNRYKKRGGAVHSFINWDNSLLYDEL